MNSGPHPSHTPAQGLAFALSGFALLSFGDAVVKSLHGAWLGPAFAMLRYAIALMGLTLWIWFHQGRAGFACPRPWVQLGRGASVSFSAGCFFAGLQFLPLAEMTAIQFTSPMIVALLSALILKERATPAVWISSATAMLGVLLVVRPGGGGLGWAVLLPLGGAFGLATMMIFNRMAAGQATVLQMQWLISLFATPLLFIFVVIGHYSGLPELHVGVPSGMVVAKASLIACSATLAHTLIYLATTRASAAQTAPAMYGQLLMALVLGYVWFGAVPDGVALAGAALIVGSGLHLWRSAR